MDPGGTREKDHPWHVPPPRRSGRRADPSQPALTAAKANRKSGRDIGGEWPPREDRERQSELRDNRHVGGASASLTQPFRRVYRAPLQRARSQRGRTQSKVDGRARRAGSWGPTSRTGEKSKRKHSSALIFRASIASPPLYWRAGRSTAE